ncbi:oxidoreductase [Herbidospora mongoliensis]|uniref:oxidoreductase n=1 Tax=Herbidospora mongoliensis TaxID=688067 RepID=UPI00082F3899|nr:oxidoreductase [Herbidospora mongoliensis]
MDDITGGILKLTDDLALTRMGYGAMRLTGPGIWGPPKDPAEAIRVLRTVADLGLLHIDTSDYYGPYVVNDLIREALYPYPSGLRIVTKVGARRGDDRSWFPAMTEPELIEAVYDNLKRLDVEQLDVVNLRMHDTSDPTIPFSVLTALQDEGLIAHLGVSNVTEDQLLICRGIAPVVCVQNEYNLVNRGDDALVDICAENGIAYVPFFPLGGFSPLQSEILDEVAQDLGATRQQTALAWLLQRSPTICVIPGTSSVAHLKENVAASGIRFSEIASQRLNAL